MPFVVYGWPGTSTPVASAKDLFRGGQQCDRATCTVVVRKHSPTEGEDIFSIIPRLTPSFQIRQAMITSARVVRQRKDCRSVGLYRFPSGTAMAAICSSATPTVDECRLQDTGHRKDAGPFLTSHVCTVRSTSPRLCQQSSHLVCKAIYAS